MLPIISTGLHARNVRLILLYLSHTRAVTVLRPYCDQFFDQIALDRSKVSLRSHYDLSEVADDLLKSLYSRSALAVQSQHSRAIGISSCSKTLRSVAISVLV